MDIRTYIKNNFKDCTKEDIKATILASVNSSDEVVLPGLGVLFEMFWNNTSNQEDITNTLFEAIKKA